MKLVLENEEKARMHFAFIARARSVVSAGGEGNIRYSLMESE